MINHLSQGRRARGHHARRDRVMSLVGRSVQLMKRVEARAGVHAHRRHPAVPRAMGRVVRGAQVGRERARGRPRLQFVSAYGAGLLARIGGWTCCYLRQARFENHRDFVNDEKDPRRGTHADDVGAPSARSPRWFAPRRCATRRSSASRRTRRALAGRLEAPLRDQARSCSGSGRAVRIGAGSKSSRTPSLLNSSKMTARLQSWSCIWTTCRCTRGGCGSRRKAAGMLRSPSPTLRRSKGPFAAAQPGSCRPR